MQAWGKAIARDCGETVASVFGVQSICMLLATVAEKGGAVWQLDTVFIFQDPEKVCVKVTSGYEAGDEATGAPLP